MVEAGSGWALFAIGFAGLTRFTDVNSTLEERAVFDFEMCAATTSPVKESTLQISTRSTPVKAVFRFRISCEHQSGERVFWRVKQPAADFTN